MLFRKFFFYIVMSLLTSTVSASLYTLENDENTIIGEIQSTQTNYEDTLLDIARKNDLGYQDVKLANESIDTWLPGEGSEILLPSQYILPIAPRNGIVLNIPEMRLYFYPKRKTEEEPLTVITYPLGVGREGWSIPYIDTKIIQKKKNPNWYPPKSIREEHEALGDPLPRIVKAGSDNPVGNYALRLGVSEYLIHGTNKPFGIGMRVSHGCIRLYPEDIAVLFSQVKLGTPVHIVNQPYKIGSLNGRIYLEAHPFLKEDANHFEENVTSVVRMLVSITGDMAYEINWGKVTQVIKNLNGIPTEVGYFVDGPLQSEA